MPTPRPTTIAEQAAAARGTEAQAVIAVRAQLPSAADVSRVESGKSNPTLRTLVALARGLGCVFTIDPAAYPELPEKQPGERQARHRERAERPVATGKSKRKKKDP